MKSDSQFITALQQSDLDVRIVASWLAKLGGEVLIRPTLVRPTADDRFAFADAGDLEIRQRVEVKGRNITFTCSEDYPYGTVIVDEARKIDKWKPLSLWGYVVLNASKTHYCCIPATTRKQWARIKRFDVKDQAEIEFYEVAKSLCWWGVVR